MEAGCTDTCSCYAEFGMTDWSGSTWQSCMFDSEGELGYNVRIEQYLDSK